MKIIKYLLGMAVVALMAAACTNDANDVLAPEGPSQEGIPFRATLSPKNMDATTRALITENEDGSLSSVWEEGDIVILEYYTNARHVSTEATVEEVSPTGYATIVAELDKSTIDGSDVDVWFNMEKNKYDGLLSTDLEIRKGSSTLKVEDGVASLVGPVDLEPLCAIVKFSIENMTGSTTAVKPLVIELGSKSITIDPTAANATLYVALPPMEDQTLWFTATDSDDKPYIAKATGNLEAGYFYQVSLKMATVGDVILANGKFAAPKTEGAEAMIAYLGTDAEDAPHGLAIALEDLHNDIISWNNSGMNNDGKTAAEIADGWNNTHTVTEGTWRLPSAFDWQRMFIACGSTNNYTEDLTQFMVFSYGDFRTMITNAGGSDFLDYYWCNTKYGSAQAWTYYFGTGSSFMYTTSGSSVYARTCLAF